MLFVFKKKNRIKGNNEFSTIKCLKVPVQPGLLPDCCDLTDPAEGADQPASHWFHTLQVHDWPDSCILLLQLQQL